MLLLIADIFYWTYPASCLCLAVLEMALWKKLAPKVFGMSREFASQTAKLASNQGLYNLFIVAALLLGYFSDVVRSARASSSTVSAACLSRGYGAWITVSRRIFFVQGVPARLPSVFAMAIQ